MISRDQSRDYQNSCKDNHRSGSGDEEPRLLPEGLLGFGFDQGAAQSVGLLVIASRCPSRSRGLGRGGNFGQVCDGIFTPERLDEFNDRLLIDGEILLAVRRLPIRYTPAAVASRSDSQAGHLVDRFGYVRAQDELCGAKALESRGDRGSGRIFDTVEHD